MILLGAVCAVALVLIGVLTALAVRPPAASGSETPPMVRLPKAPPHI